VVANLNSHPLSSSGSGVLRYAKDSRRRTRAFDDRGVKLCRIERCALTLDLSSHRMQGGSRLLSCHYPERKTALGMTVCRRGLMGSLVQTKCSSRRRQITVPAVRSHPPDPQPAPGVHELASLDDGRMVHLVHCDCVAASFDCHVARFLDP
jgi:hypothetical protein